MFSRGSSTFPRVVVVLIALGEGRDVSRADDEHLRDTSTPTATCLSCHPYSVSHPVDVDYEQAVNRRRGDLREASEVLRRGVFLPAGHLTCHTCHDVNSPWKFRLAIPPGSKVHGAVVPGDRTTYEASRPAARSMTVEEAKATLPSGYALSPTPLCLACHAME